MQKDIIERTIEQFVAGIAYIFQLRKENQEEQASEYINTELLKYTGLKPENILGLPENLATDLIFNKCSNKPDLGIYISDTLKEQAEIFLNKGLMTESRKLFKVSLNILNRLALKPEYENSEKIKKKIKYLKHMS